MANKFPDVLAYEGKIVCSDALMYSCNFETREKTTKIQLLEKAVRGTKSNKAKSKDYDKLAEANLQRVDAAFLGADDDTLLVSFTVKFLGNVGVPVCCNDYDYQNMLEQKVNEAIEKQSLKEISRRYALNIANARYLFRNRQGAEKISVVVTCHDPEKGEEEKYEFDALEIPSRNFEYRDPKIDELAESIQRALESKDKYILLDVNAYAKIGRGQVVYPSQELVLDRGNDTHKKSKILYKTIEDQAGMHSQKIGNAIRTIDTFYREYSKFGPIPVEPYGAVTTIAKVFRHPTEKHDFYSLLDKFVAGEMIDEGDINFLIAVLIRGGVFGAKDE